MSIPIYEQETTVSFMRDEDKAVVYTSDKTVMTKLDKKVEDENSPWELKNVGTVDEEIVSKEYITDKKLISFRTRHVEREMTEEERQQAAERLRNIQRRRREKQAEAARL